MIPQTYPSPSTEFCLFSDKLCAKQSSKCLKNQVVTKPTKLTKIYIYNTEVFYIVSMEISELKLSQINQIGSRALSSSERSEYSHQISRKQRNGSGSIFREQNYGFQNNFQEESELRQEQTLKNISFWKTALIVITLVQLSIKISVILIQYTSSKIRIGLFCILAIITLILATLTILSLVILSIRKIRQSLLLLLSTEHNLIILGAIDKQSLTVPKMVHKQEEIVSQKTSKVLEGLGNSEREPEQTNKNLRRMERETQRKQTDSFFSGVSLNTNLQIIITAKVIENTLSLIGCVFVFCVYENPVQFGFAQTQLLLILGFTLIVFSSAFLVTLYLKIKQFIIVLSRVRQAKAANFKKQAQFQAHRYRNYASKADTVLSIDNHIPNNSLNLIKSKKLTKWNGSIMKNRPNEHQHITQSVIPSPAANLKNVCFSQHHIKADKFQSQNGVLKKPNIKSKNQTSRFQPSKTQQNESQMYIQRRKVEINSKKIQYFEYANISPANSQTLNDEQFKKFAKAVSQKPKIHSQRARNFIAKKANQELILQRKKQLNNKRSLTKSAKLARQSHEKEFSQQQQGTVVFS